MTVQLIRKARDRQPLRQPRIDYSNGITKDIVFSFEAGVGNRDLVTAVAGEPLLSGVSPSSGLYGRQYSFSGSQANRSCSFGLHKALCGATSATWDILVYFNSSNPSANIFNQWDSNSLWLLQASAGSLIWVAADDDLGNRRRWDMSSAFTSSGWYRIIASWQGVADKVLLINGINKSDSLSVVSSLATQIETTNTGDYLQIGMSAYGSALQGSVCFARAWKRGLTLSECKSLHEKPWQIFDPETIPLFYSTVTAQYARPTSDVSTGTWTSSLGGSLYAAIDETVASDTDYITTTNASTCEVALSSLSDPASSAGHIVRYRISATSGGITVRLRQGTTTIATWTHATAPTSLTTYSQTLTSGEADSITDYTTLRLQFEAT